MAELIPFRAVLYNPENVGDMAKVVAPPYDIISEKMQDELYRSHQYNIVRLILGKTIPKDTLFNNRYTRARDYLGDWLDKGILKKDTGRTFYIYQQKYLHRDKLKTRTGFIALMKIEDPRKSQVLPHEYTFLDPKKDRLKLINEAKANLSPIFSLFEDEDNHITNILAKIAARSQPFVSIEMDGVSHKLWRIRDKDSIRKIKNFMKPKAVFIADGHHRYEVALTFRNQMKKKESFKPAFNYVMVYFSNLNQDAITILSTHRVIKDTDSLTIGELLSRLRNFFEIRELRDRKRLFLDLGKTKQIRFGLYCGKKRFYLLTLRDEGILDRLVYPDKSLHWKRLPVTVLHQLVFNRILNIKEKIAKEENVIYTKDEEYAISLVDREGYKIAFFLNPTSVKQLKDIAQLRDKMPHKSTYFYPKLLSGLVINKF